MSRYLYSYKYIDSQRKGENCNDYMWSYGQVARFTFWMSLHGKPGKTKKEKAAERVSNPGLEDVYMEKCTPWWKIHVLRRSNNGLYQIVWNIRTGYTNLVRTAIRHCSKHDYHLMNAADRTLYAPSLTGPERTRLLLKWHSLCVYKSNKCEY